MDVDAWQQLGPFTRVNALPQLRGTEPCIDGLVAMDASAGSFRIYLAPSEI